jgi:hypothetical protein
MISKGITRRAFLIGLGGLGLGTLAYWFLKSVEFGKGIEEPVPTSSPTSTLTPTSTSTPTSTPTATPTINREEVERLKSKYGRILVEIYPTLWKLLNSPSPPIVIDYYDVKKYFLGKTWEKTNIVNNGDRGFVFAVQPDEGGTIKIILPKEAEKGLYQTNAREDRFYLEALEGIKDRTPTDDVIWVFDETTFNEFNIVFTVKIASLDKEIETKEIGSKLVLEAVPGKGKLCRWCIVEITGWNIPKSKILTDEEIEKYFLGSIFLVILMERLISKTTNTFEIAKKVKEFLNDYRLHYPTNTVLASDASFQAVLELILEIMKKWEK